MHRSTRIVIGLAAALLLAVAASTVNAQNSQKIGVFDPQRVSEETIEGQLIQARLSEMRDQRQQEIVDEQNKINDLQQQLEQQALSLSVERRTQMEIDIQKRLLELNSRKDTMTRAFQLDIAAEEAQFNEKLRAVVDQFAANEEFDLIFETGAVAFFSSAVDVTTAIIDRFDQMFPGPAED